MPFPVRAVCGAIVTVLGLVTSVPADDQAETKTKPGASKTKPSAGKSKTAREGPSAGATVKLEKATFGGGCFWCLEAVFEHVKGVKSVVSGYAGGTVPKPYYELVGTGMTGHAEVVQVEYDPEVVSYDELLKYFFSAHDPTTPNRQGPDEGTQYRSVILYHNDDQKQAALKMYQKLTRARVFATPIVTQLTPMTHFYPAERYHQNYYRNHRYDPYCETYIVPKLQMIRIKQAAERAAAASEKSEK